MIDTDKYEGHTEEPWLLAIWESGERVSADKEKDPTYCYNYEVVDEEDNVIASIEESGGGLYADSNANLLADAPLLLAEVKRLRKLEAAVVGSWMETINRGSSWHKQLRDPCVELGYLTYDDCYELPKKYQDMAKEWVKEYYGDDDE